MEKVPNRIPTRTLEQPEIGVILNIEDLEDQERLAILDAIEAYKSSTNKEFRAGACAVAFNGEKSVKHNHTNEPGKGQEGHAEMLALQALYETVSPADRKLKLLALAASYPDQELVRTTEKYDAEKVIRDINEIDIHRICGRCLKMISDYTGNGLSLPPEWGEQTEPINPTLLLLTGTGQVLRTTLKALHPAPHIPHQTDIRPWAKGDPTKAPDMNTGK